MGKHTLLESWEKRTSKAGAEDCWEWLGTRTRGGYGTLAVWRGGKWRSTCAHRIAFELFVGPIPPNRVIDHTCYNRSCVNPAHLRVLTNRQNIENRSGANRNNASGYRSVIWDKSKSKWMVNVCQDRKSHFGGYFSDPEEANKVAIALRNRLFTHNDADRAA